MPKIGKDLLSDISVKKAQPQDKAYALRDGGGLWLIIEPAGKKWWKLRTTFVKKANSFSLGEYPTVTLSNAREKREAIRKGVFSRRNLRKFILYTSFQNFPRVVLPIPRRPVQSACILRHGVSG